MRGRRVWSIATLAVTVAVAGCGATRRWPGLTLAADGSIAPPAGVGMRAASRDFGSGVAIVERATRASTTRATAGLAACPPPRSERQITHRRWLHGVIVTEYYPAPERWFNGRPVSAPGLPGRHRVDWLYSARGLSMEGDGLDSHGRLAHIADLGDSGWVNSAGHGTVPPPCGTHWSHGAPAWRAGGWRNRAGQVTYPLRDGGWSNGHGHLVGGYGGASFALGQSLPLTFYHSVAVDPHLIPEGSRIFIPEYRTINGGWFVAQDTGGAIIGRHIDVYRPPTPQPFGDGRLLLHARAYVIPPGG